MSCSDCRDEIEHCHAVWVRHRDGHEECLGLECRSRAHAHVLVVVCTEVDPACCP